jgi:hypothetical protein
MANPTGKGGKKFKPGQSGNPRGRQPLRPDLRRIQLMTADDSKRLLQKLMDLPKQSLEDLAADPSTPAMDLMVIQIILKAVQDGDHARLNFLFDRTIGKVLDKKEIEVRPVTYVTKVRADGTLIQDVLEEEMKG